MCRTYSVFQFYSKCLFFKKILAKEEFSCSSGINWQLQRLQTQSRSKTIFICLMGTAWLISSVHSLSCVWPFVTQWTTAHQASLSITNSRVYSNSCPLGQWCHPTISSSVIPFSSCLLSFASGSFPMSQLFESSGQSTGVSASASVLPMNTQDLSPLG